MMQFWIVFAGLPVGIWIYFLTLRDRFWMEQPSQWWPDAGLETGLTNNHG